jgi:two-component system, NtrC family, sensor histidine kinase KinB
VPRHWHYARVRDALQQLRSNGKSNRIEVELHVRGRTHSYVLKPIELVQEGSSIGTLLILQDVTYLRDQDRARTNLIATLSHELRTPLTSMIIATQTMERQKASLSPSLSQMVEVSVEETSRMNQLLDNLMNLARGNIPSIPTRREKLPIDQLVADTVRRFVIQADEKHVKLESHVGGAPVIEADRVQLSWVLSNLVGNALRYTPAEGKIEVLADETQNKLVRLEVADTGPGIPPEVRDQVFERFAQHATPGYEPGAAGLGLAIVKDIVEAHGGRISVESNNGHGSRFVVMLPASDEA